VKLVSETFSKSWHANTRFPNNTFDISTPEHPTNIQFFSLKNVHVKDQRSIASYTSQKRLLWNMVDQY